MYPDAPHLRVPLRLDGGRLAVVEQDSPEEVAQCVRTLLTTPPGFRMTEPEYGTPDQSYADGGADPDVLLEAVEQWEPRALAWLDDLDDDAASPLDRLRLHIADSED